MFFVSEICTDALFGKLNLPDVVRTSQYDDPIDMRIIFNAEEKIALFVSPMNHGTYPDQRFILSINGKIIRGRETPKGQDVLDCVIEILASSNTHGFSYDYIIPIIRQTFAIHHNSDKCPYDVVVR